MFERGKIATAVVTGHHAHDVVALHSLFRSIPEIDAYPQNMEEFVTDTGGARKHYDVVVFYNMHRPTPDAVLDDLGPKMKKALEELGDTEQGILLLHHAILAFPDWQRWSDISGFQDRGEVSGAKGQMVRYDIENTQHPITQGLSSWEMADEVYIMPDAREGNDVLLTTDHPSSMKTIGWTREYGSSRVFCYQSGHDDQAFSNASFRTVVARGIQWLARRI